MLLCHLEVAGKNRGLELSKSGYGGETVMRGREDEMWLAKVLSLCG